MRVRLMATCLADALFGDAAIAATRVLEAAGHEVEFDTRQTCCGQPAFNYGDREAARRMAHHQVAALGGPTGPPVVTPSASCAATLRHAYPALGVDGPIVYELSEFLTGPGGVGTWRGRVTPQRAAYHEPCHTRALGTAGLAQRLLAGITGLSLVDRPVDDPCCGFGGVFAVTHHTVSASMGTGTLDRLAAESVEALLSADVGCLMHLEGLASRRGQTLRVRHYAEVLAEALG